MIPIDFNTLAQQCAPAVHPMTLQAVVRTESGFNPFAIGVVGGRLARQPRNRDEAVATARALEAAGWNFSMGLSQVNRANLIRYGLNITSVFDPCANLRAGSAILTDCYARASSLIGSGQRALLAAFSCYYSGNFERGFRPDVHGTSYVQRVAADASTAIAPHRVVPAIPVIPDGASGVRGRDHVAGHGRESSSAQALSKDEPKRAAWDAFGSFRSL